MKTIFSGKTLIAMGRNALMDWITMTEMKADKNSASSEISSNQLDNYRNLITCPISNFAKKTRKNLKDYLRNGNETFLGNPIKSEAPFLDIL